MKDLVAPEDQSLSATPHLFSIPILTLSKSTQTPEISFRAAPIAKNARWAKIQSQRIRSNRLRLLVHRYIHVSFRSSCLRWFRILQYFLLGLGWLAILVIFIGRQLALDQSDGWRETWCGHGWGAVVHDFVGLAGPVFRWGGRQEGWWFIVREF